MSENNVQRQGAFIGEGKFLKGGLHCHTTRSDGRLSPEDTERKHAENGYDFLAITDHRNYNRTDYAPDAGLLIIPGMEFDATFVRDDGFRCFHTVCLGPDDDTNGFADGERCESGKVNDQFDFQEYLNWIHSKNNITFYCHPEWSSTPARYFDKLVGEFAMEVWNSGCAIEDDMDYNAPYWDEMLGLGHKIWGVAVDDGHAEYQHCNGWVMVKAEKNVNAVLTALKEGNFYSSCGPEIKDFYIEDGKAHVVCSPVSKILFCADRHPSRKISCGDGEELTSAEIDLKDSYKYVRATVVDENGNRAWTNPIFIK